MMCEVHDGTGWKPQANLVSSGEAVKRVTKDLIQTADQKAGQSNNQTYYTEMKSACELLETAGDNFHLASLRLQANVESKDARRCVVQAAKDVLQGTMKVLMIADEGEVSAILQAADSVRDRLHLLVSVNNMTDLVATFRMFTEAVIQLTGLATRRQQELIHPRQREKVIMGLGLLKKAVPLLNAALQSSVKYTANPQTKISQDYAVKQIETGITELTDAISNRFTDEDYLGLEESGFFVSRVDQLLEGLAEANRDNVTTDFELWTQDVIAHSMAVAHLCVDKHRDFIIHNCQRILQQKGRMCEVLGVVISNPDSMDVRNDYDSVCESLIDEFCDLERHVNMAVLHLIVSTFWQTTETLETLVKAAMQQQQNGKNVLDWMSVLNEHITCFGEHSDKVCQVASLAAASSTDARRVRSIRLCIHRLEQLDPEIVPAAVSCLKSSKDKLAIQHMKLLKEEWKREFVDLLQVLDDMTDPKIFMEVSEEQLSVEVNTCRGLLAGGDLEEVGDLFPNITGKAGRVAAMAKQIVDDHEDPLYRNGLMVYVERLRKAILGVKEALRLAIEEPMNRTALQTMKRRLGLIPEGVGLVREALSKQFHPHILSSLRHNIRLSRATLAGELKQDVPHRVPELTDEKIIEQASENPFLSAPVPDLSNQGPSGVLESLALSSSVDKEKETISTGVQCGISQGQASKSVQTKQEHHVQQDQKSSNAQVLELPVDRSSGVSVGCNTEAAVDGLIGKITGTSVEPSQSGRVRSSSQDVNPQISWNQEYVTEAVSPQLVDRPTVHASYHSSHKNPARTEDISVKENILPADRPDFESDNTSPRSVLKMSTALQPRVADAPGMNKSPRHWQGNRQAPVDSRFTDSTVKPVTVRESSQFKPQPYSPRLQASLRAKGIRNTEFRDTDNATNPIVEVAQEMTRLFQQVEQYGKKDAPKTSHHEMLKTAKSLSKCGQTMLKFLQGISKHCLDKRFGKDMSYHIHHVSMATVQLDILSSVLMASPEDTSTDEMMVKTAKRLMAVVRQGLKAAETACVKGLHEPSPDAEEEMSAFILAMQWKAKWDEQRHLEATTAQKDELGLRRINVHNPPSLAELIFH